ncbi:hypothetical protein WA171_001253, partial [Blastocystis sp. BT1]
MNDDKETTVISNPLLKEDRVDECHMSKVLDTEDKQQLGRTPSSELLSNIKSLHVTNALVSAGKRYKVAYRKVAKLGIKSRMVECPYCHEVGYTIVRRSYTSWILPFVICVIGISILVFVLLDLNKYFIVYYGIGAVIVVAVMNILSHVFSGQNRHFCSKCNNFIGIENELVLL